ncbi:hypothetical protein roselon_02927 [Roseibacterium elongatum DSM 19469]|uniref:Uncharacterized protein n=1 Tax=Roseicyclus elongatus DSM 19469 TaxID=1294273 RepID=W8RVH3_9RHOB|nr:hypothetical protein [Roseibacterium elongatum]AHM05214.1 hypothetical protein roselon_02927 [Roseibacterium elongatum DSM 19469]
MEGPTSRTDVAVAEARMRDTGNKRSGDLQGFQSDGPALHGSRVLAVALPASVLDLLPRNVLEPHSYIARADYDELDSMNFAGRDAPALVLSPLLTPVFDAIDLARYLSQRAYRGRYLALVEKLPSANLIRREVEAQSPDLNFDVIVLDGSTPLHSL